MSTGSVFSTMRILTVFSKTWNEYMFENANVQKFIKSTDFHFDIVVADDFYSESSYMLAYKHKAPLITICKFSNGFKIQLVFRYNLFKKIQLGPFGVTEFIDRQQGLLSPPSFVSQTVS